VRRRYNAGVAAVRERLFVLAREAMAREDWLYSPACMSGADRAEAPVYASVRRFYEAVAMGGELEEAARVEDARWRAYAVENNAKIAAGPKLQHGPMSGAPAMHYRYTSPELFQSKLPHLRTMVAIARGRA
jgi:hypothetical protein